MKTLRISPDLALPADTVTSTLIVYGGKGMGKSVFGSVLGEELAAARLRWSFLDPLGVNWGIRHAADGVGPGVECLILGGVHGDIPIYPDGGAAVADVVVEESCNVLVDFSRSKNGEAWGVGEKIRFSTAYARRLFQRQGSLIDGRKREPLMQILDEGARFIPQIIPAGNPDLAMCVSAWQQFAEEGRNVGLGLCVLTQRSARMNKDIAELADAMIAFRTIGPNSVGAVLDWLGEHVERSRIKDLSEQVRKLPRGSALVVSPGWLEVEKVVAMRMRRTFDSSATPKPGERVRTARGEGAKPDLAKIQARMAETIERAKADDPKELRKRIAELEKELRAKPKGEATVERVEVPVPFFDAAVYGAMFEQILTEIGGGEKIMAELRSSVGRHLKRYQEAAQAARALGEKGIARAALRYPPGNWDAGKVREFNAFEPKARPPIAHRDPKPSNGAARRQTADVRMLTVLAQHRGSAMTVDRLALHLGVHPRTKSFTNKLSELRSAGYVDGCEITAQGLEHLGPYDALPTGTALFEWWRDRKLRPAESKILEAIAERDSWSTEELAARLAVHPRTKTFTNTIGKLRGLGLVNGLRLSEELVG